MHKVYRIKGPVDATDLVASIGKQSYCKQTNACLLVMHSNIPMAMFSFWPQQLKKTTTKKQTSSESLCKHFSIITLTLSHKNLHMCLKKNHSSKSLLKLTHWAFNVASLGVLQFPTAPECFTAAHWSSATQEGAFLCTNVLKTIFLKS